MLVRSRGRGEVKRILFKDLLRWWGASNAGELLIQFRLCLGGLPGASNPGVIVLSKAVLIAAAASSESYLSVTPPARGRPS